jgi:hypothetical protein
MHNLYVESVIGLISDFKNRTYQVNKSKNALVKQLQPFKSLIDLNDVAEVLQVCFVLQLERERNLKMIDKRLPF